MVSHETKLKTELKCHGYFSSKLRFSSMQLEHAHRIRQRKDGKSRMNITKLLSHKDRESIVNKASEEHPQGVFINQDFLVKVSKFRKP